MNAIGSPLESQGFERVYRKLVMYEDLNAAGTIFGGTLVSWMDEASAIFAGETMHTRRIVTKKISELLFQEPANLGDLLEIWCRTSKEGTSSLTVEVLVMRRSAKNDEEVAMHTGEVCRSEFVFVAIDKHGRPKPWVKKT